LIIIIVRHVLIYQDVDSVRVQANVWQEISLVLEEVQPIAQNGFSAQVVVWLLIARLQELVFNAFVIHYVAFA